MISKRRDSQGSRECTTELHRAYIIEHRLTKSGTKMKRSLTDDDDVPQPVP